MTGTAWLALISLVLIVLVAAAWYLSYTAARLDRLHAKVTGCWRTVETQLVRRAEAIVELANSGALDAASSFLLASAASDVLDLDADDRHTRIPVENDLAEATCTVLHESDLDEELDELLAAAERRVQLAATFHNDAVLEVQRMRANPVIRAFRLAGHAPMPSAIELETCTLAGASVAR